MIPFVRIYVLHLDPGEAAKALCDNDLLNRILMVAQVLCGAHHVHGNLLWDGPQNCFVLKEGRPGHRMLCPLPDGDRWIEWAAEARGNYDWTRRYLKGLLNEYQYRWGDDSGKRHKTWGTYEGLYEAPRLLRARDVYAPSRMTPFVADESGAGSDDIVALHNRMYLERLRQLPSFNYRKRELPGFLSASEL